ncbi:hypothetical protein HanHA89_Chr01g0029271 [Helianthus annuus]|nr:hypothetical protein HanHA89_Chr01g0029271 [Helianthus annuus]
MRDQSEQLESCSTKRKQHTHIHTHRVCVCVRERAGKAPHGAKTLNFIKFFKLKD